MSDSWVNSGLSTDDQATQERRQAAQDNWVESWPGNELRNAVGEDNEPGYYFHRWEMEGPFRWWSSERDWNDE